MAIKKMDDNRKKALAAALGQIEKQFGKGSVMRLGDRWRVPRDIEVDLDGLARPRCRVGCRRRSERPGRRNIRPGVFGQDDDDAAG